MYIFFGHHKCASTYVASVLFDIFSKSGYSVAIGQLTLLDLKKIQNLSNKYHLFISLNSDYTKIENLHFEKGFHVIRDLRDILVSGYFSHLNSHSTEGWPGLLEHRLKLKNLEKAEGLIEEHEFSRYFFSHLINWDYSNPSILECKMEELTNDDNWAMKVLNHFKIPIEDIDIPNVNIFRRTLMRAFQRMNLIKYAKKPKAISRELIIHTLERYSFQNLSGGRPVGVENKNAHYRKGIPGDWKNHFNPELEELFKLEYVDFLSKHDYN